VARLLDWGAPAAAEQHWRWVESVRGATPAEAVAAAALEEARGHANHAIRWLRSAVPELGTVDMDRAPAEVVRAYLPLRWPAELVAAAAENGLEPWLLAGVARQESVFVASARSPAGAVGVLQLLPGTARGHARALGFGARPDLTDPSVNLRLGARELADLLGRFGAVEPALAAYNGGPARASRWWRLESDPRRFAEAVPVPETYNYIRRVVYLAEAYRLVYADEWRSSR
jgi:soluble lytic murein transglycosylase